MHKLRVEGLQAGLRLAKTIYGTRGEVVLARGACLTDQYIAGLRARGFQAVYVMDGIADDVEPLGPVSERLRCASVQTVGALYELMAAATQPVRDVVAAEGAHVLPAVPLEISGALQAGVKAVERTVESLLAEVLGKETVDGLTALKAHDNYTFEHSVDVAVYAVILGQRLRLSRDDLRDLALGSLLHDIGKMYIDERILRKPGKLDEFEFAAITQHTMLGFQMLRQLPLPNSRPAHVALQHHEKQDASGYPNNLWGTNRIHRTQRERFDLRRISLFAELTAVADVCSALSSDRPYRLAMPSAEVLKLMREMAGHHLNREAVEAFVAAVQPFPVGTLVRISGGMYHRCAGVVVMPAPRGQDRARPAVRLLGDRFGRPLHDLEVALWEQPRHVELATLADGASLEELACQPRANGTARKMVSV